MSVHWGGRGPGHIGRGRPASAGNTGPIVQHGLNSNASGSISNVTLAAPPTNGNLLVALVSGQNVGGAVGWTRFRNNGFGTTYSSLWYRFAGAGESATVEVLDSTYNFAVIGLYEIVCTNAPTIANGDAGSTASRTIALTNTASATDIVLGHASGDGTTALPSSIGTATSDGTIVGSGRSMQIFHRIGTSDNQSETVTYAAATDFRMDICIVSP